MILILLAIIFTSILIWWQVRWSRVRSFWEKRGVPHSAPHPLMGSLTFLQRENPAAWLRRMYEEFRTPYFGIWLFWQPALVINSPDLAKNVLVKDSDNFRNRFLSSGKSDPIGSLNLFTTNEPLWSNVRRKLTSVFTASKLRILQTMMRDKAEDLTTRVGLEMSTDPQLFDLRMVCTDFTTDVIGESAFGIKSEATKTRDSPIRKVTRDFMKFNLIRGLSWSSIFFFPTLVDIFGFKFFPRKTTDYLREVFRTVVQQRGGFEKPVTEPRDLLDALIKIKQNATIDEQEMSEDILMAQATVFLQAGFDTSGAALTWCIYELAHQPHLQDKLYQELLIAKENCGTDKLDSTQLAELNYLNAVIKETMRKYSPMGWLDRVSAKDYKVDENLTIPAGTVVYVNAHGMQWDENYFPDPEIFNPDRFLPENEKNIKPYTYMPFGEGPRSCIGMRFALQTIRFGLFSLFLKYSVHPLEHAIPPNSFPVETKGLFLTPGEKMSVKFIPRD